MRVCVIGLGEVGLPTAKYISSKGIEVVGYDIKKEAVERAEKNGITAMQNWQQVPVCDVYLICVYVGVKNGTPELSPILDVCYKIKDKGAPNLVSIESTIMPHLCREIFNNIFEKHIKLVHVPHRFWKEDPVNHGVNQLRVIGGADTASLKEGIRFYEETLRIPLYPVPIIEIAEMTKITEQAYRYIQIAFAEELRVICERAGLDFAELRKACNTKWNISIPDALDGIGGECLPKDIKFFNFLAKKSLFAETAMLADIEYRKFLEKKRKKNQKKIV